MVPPRWEHGLAPLLHALSEGCALAPRLRVLECGANPACERDEVADMVLRLRSVRPGLHVHWNASDEGNKAEGAAFERSATPTV